MLLSEIIWPATGEMACDSALDSNHPLIPILTLTAAASIPLARRLEVSAVDLGVEMMAFAVVIFYGVWRSYVFPFFVSDLRHVPTVPGFPLWGQFFSIISEECGVPQRRWHTTYGPIIRYFFPFGAERLSIADDAAIHHMTVKNPYNFPKPVRAKLWMVRILGEGILLAENDVHVSQRKTLSPGFSIRAIRTFTPTFWNQSLLMADLMKEEADAAGRKAGRFEILEWLNRCTLDIIGEAGFGYNLESLRKPWVMIREAYRLVFNFDLASRALHGLQAFFPSSKHLPAKMNRDMDTARAIIIHKANEIISARLQDAESCGNAKDVLSLIAKENRKLKLEGETGLTHEAMRDQVMTFLGAGHDTTASGTAWTVYLLATYPRVQERLRAEIREHFPWLFEPRRGLDRAARLAGADPDHLRYLDSVCREALRFIPPIPMTVRESQRDDVLGGYKVPAHTVVYVLANSINHMPWFWGGDADDFVPERWAELPQSAVPNAFMTFLQGPRGCLGRKFAEVEMKVLLCVLLSSFEFRRDFDEDDPEDWKMWRLVLRPKEGIPVIATPLPHMYEHAQAAACA